MAEIRHTDPVLCYVDRSGVWAYFTTRQLDQQWGDDWDDQPYESNSGVPYEWAPHRDCSHYTVVRVAFDGPYAPPCCGYVNSPWSVEQINRGDIAWLRAYDHPPIPAGTPLSVFRERIAAAGGCVYEPLGTPDARVVRALEMLGALRREVATELAAKTQRGGQHVAGLRHYANTNPAALLVLERELGWIEDVLKGQAR